ncbi:hypothetical protein TrST_g5034 [Triparma strigata]|uniref:PH domain-containing protein n=1 Tax=Triparma strigata TaxID=1606541 RepID=A0A9W7C2M6_9STRA|nr:hypothetical protein TrST_g5034 [Triparma strigata]
MEGTLGILDVSSGNEEWISYATQLTDAGVLSLTSTTPSSGSGSTSSFEISVISPSTSRVSPWSDGLGFSLTFENGRNMGFRTESKAKTAIWVAEMARYVEVEEGGEEEREQHTGQYEEEEDELQTPLEIPSVNSSIDDSNTSLLHTAQDPSPISLSHSTKDVMESYARDMKAVNSGLPPLPKTSLSPPRPPPQPSHPPQPNPLNTSTLSLLDSPSTSLNNTVQVPLPELLQNASDAQETLTSLLSLQNTVSSMKKSHSQSLARLTLERDELERKVSHLTRSLDSSTVAAEDYKRRMDLMSSSSAREIVEVESLKSKVTSLENTFLEERVAKIEEVKGAVEEATEEMEGRVREERERGIVKRKKAEEGWRVRIEREMASLEDSLAQSHALDKAVALASAQKDFASKLSSHKSTLELKWSKKFQKLQSQYTQQKLSTARDVKQLTTLHASHVRALEKSLNDETIRLEKSRQQIKYLTIQRANESAKYASERERNSLSAAENLKEISEMRIIIKRLTQQRLDAERQSTVLSSETKRIGEDKRMEEAKVQGIRARLAEAEAEVMVLRREREELSAFKAGGDSVLEVLRRENAVLRRECTTQNSELKKMKDVLENVNRNIYGRKAAEMCRGVALGKREVLGNMSNRGRGGESGGGGGGKKNIGGGKRKPFV